MDMCDLRRELKKTKFEPGCTYKQINNTIKKEIRIAKKSGLITNVLILENVKLEKIPRKPTKL